MAIGGRSSTWKHGTNGAIAVNTDFTAKTMSVQPNFNADEADMTVFGNGYRSFEQTFKDAEISVTYKYDTTIFGQLAAIYNNGDTVTWELGPTGTTGGGINVKETGSMFLKSFSHPINVGDGLKIETQWRVDGAVTFTTFT